MDIVAVLAQRESLRALAGEQAIAARSLIGDEKDTSQRASLLGDLSRAMLPASIDEASTYFSAGLDEMDAIGSGDYQFTNDLLLFAAQVQGQELDERSFHALTNLCELSMEDEPEKFPWGAYGRGISRIAGLRGLTKLGRWHSRSKIALRHTLLPYLTGLIKHDKIRARDAVALNRLAKSAEYYFASTKEFTEALRAQGTADPGIVADLVAQVQDENPDLALGETVDLLASLTRETLGSDSEAYKHLEAACARQAEDRRSWAEEGGSEGLEPEMRKERANRKRANSEALKRIAAGTDPTDEVELASAIEHLNALDKRFDSKGNFFSCMRQKVPYDKRGMYVRNIAALDNVSFYWKISELKETWTAWERSSAALAEEFVGVAYPLIRCHAADLVEGGHGLGARVAELSELTKVAASELTIELVKVLVRENRRVDGAIWIACARYICPKADAGQGQEALESLLSGKAARLAESVTEDSWMAGLYPRDDFVEIAAGMIWLLLGSPLASDRWRSAHCLRRFAGNGRWDIIDRVVAKLDAMDPGPFHAPEVPFFHMHARLWLLIALARTACDSPSHVARYKTRLLAVVQDTGELHVLMRHFASRALCECLDTKALALPEPVEAQVRSANSSPHPPLSDAVPGRGNSFSGRPDGVALPAFQFDLNYDFRKYAVNGLARVFDQPCWKVSDLISEIVHEIDPSINSMHESPGRDAPSVDSAYDFSTKYHTHGQQLGWHGLLIAAGRLLEEYPITKRQWDDGNAWSEWLRTYTLSLEEGFWLSDGTDRIPLDIGGNLLEKNDKRATITGDRNKILTLAGLGSHFGDNVVVHGDWVSTDGVRVDISSILVKPGEADSYVRELLEEEPFIVGVPYCRESEEEGEVVSDEQRKGTPWIVWPEQWVGLDQDDPYGVSGAVERARLARCFASACSLAKNDSFGRIWKDKCGRTVLRAQAWGRNSKEEEHNVRMGARLLCARSVVEEVLTKFKKELLVLIKLQRREQESDRSRRYFHTVAVVRVTTARVPNYYAGSVDQMYKPGW